MEPTKKLPYQRQNTPQSSGRPHWNIPMDTAKKFLWNYPQESICTHIGTADRDALKPRRIARSNQRSIGHIFRYCYQHWINFRTLSKDVISSSSYALADTIKAGGTAIEDVEEGGADIFNSIFGVIPGVLGMASLLIVLCIARYFIYKWYVTSCFKSAPTFNPN